MTQKAEEAILVSDAELREWAARAFMRVDVPSEDAATAADALVAANLRGVDTHGIVRLPINVKRIQKGAINPRPGIRIERDNPSLVLVDGDNGLGFVVGSWAMREAIQRARQNGSAVAAVRHSNHFSAAAYYAQLASSADMVGLSYTNTDSGMAPWGSVTPYFGTNPMAFAAPGGIEGGIVVDMATSQVSWGKVLLAARAGQKIPVTWATDRKGRPTDDPKVGMEGLMLPLGGYKGYGLAFMVEALCGIMTGAAFGPRIGAMYSAFDRDMDAGHFFMAIDISRLMPVERFKERMRQMVDEIHAGELAEGVQRIYVPGEIEAETAARRRQEGIPLPADLVTELRGVGESVGEPFPG